MSRDALVIGINKYNFSGLSALRSPANDAEAIAKRLSEAGDFYVKRLPEFLDPFDDNARRVAEHQEVKVANLEKALEELFYPEAFSADGERIVSGSNDKTVGLWDVNGNPIGQPLIGHESQVLSVTFSAYGERIVSGSNDKTVRLWDVNGNPIGQPFVGHEDWVRSVAFSADGERIVSGSDDETVRIWDAATGKCIQIINYKLCAGLNITGVTGLTSAQRLALKLMGAIDKL